MARLVGLDERRDLLENVVPVLHVNLGDLYALVDVDERVVVGRVEHDVHDARRPSS